MTRLKCLCRCCVGKGSGMVFHGAQSEIMPLTIERVTEAMIVGEAPHWDVDKQVLYFVDAYGKTINKYDPATNLHTSASVDAGQVSFVIPVRGKDNNFVIGLDRHVAIASWDDHHDEIRILQKLDSVESPKLLDDGKCDSTGRLWTGDHAADFKYLEKTQPVASLYHLDCHQRLQVQLNGIKISNGMAWNDLTNKMYHIDSLKYGIDQFDFDPVTGTLSNGRTWFSFKTHDIPGMPDGMTIDTDGNLWVAVFGGARVIKIDGFEPESLLETIKMDADQVTSVAWGGPDLNELYVTTASIKLPQPINGATYRITGTGATGFTSNNFNFT